MASGVHVSEIKVGDNVRSYDFPHRQDCYIEGVVLAVNDPVGVYRIKPSLMVQGGKLLERTEFFDTFPPLNGQEGLFGTTCGVVKI
jgi:hypothetical protein